MSRGWRQRLPAWSPAGWAVAAAVALIGTALIALLLIPRDYYTGTNSVRVRDYIIEVPPDTRMCITKMHVPAGTGRVEFKISTDGNPQPQLDLALEIGGRTLRSSLPPGPSGQRKIVFAIPETPAEPEWQEARGCIRTGAGSAVHFGGVPGLVAGDGPIIVGKNTFDGRVATWYRPPAGGQRSVLSELPKVFERAGLFKASWVGPWTYWLLFLVVLPALLATALWVLLSAERRRRLPLLVGLLAVANATAWAHITPAFQAPDESEHFAYVESLAQRGKPLSAAKVPDPLEPYSSDQSAAIEATRVHSSNETFDGRPPWLEIFEAEYEERVAREDPARDDGGGFAIAASAHSPVYYSLLIPAYEVGGAGGVFDELTLMRMTSALLGGLVAACTVLLVLELLPGRRLVAAAAGLLVGFQPMFGFMSGTVNNDMGVNAAAACLLLLLIRTLRRGFVPWQSAALGLVLAVLPLMKGTGYALYPAALLALGLAFWRWRSTWRRQLPGVAALAATFAAGYGLWSVVSGSLDRSSFTTPGGDAPGTAFAAFSNIPDALAYVWQVFLPKLPFMADHWAQSWPAQNIYGKRGWGAFGWYAISWPESLYRVIMLVMIGVAVLGVVTLWQRRRWARANLFEILVLLTAVTGVVTAVHFAYYIPGVQGESYPEQGRYAFPVITALAVLGVGAMFALRSRAEAAIAGLAAGVIAFSYASMWLVVAVFYLLVLN